MTKLSGALLRVAAIGLLAAVPRLAVAQGFEPLPSSTELKTIENQEVRLEIRPEIRITTAGNKNTVDLKVHVDLSDLQAKSTNILNAMIARQNTGGLEWSFPTLGVPIAVDGTLQIAGEVRVKGELLGIEATETATFVLALTPQHTETMISVVANLVHFDLGDSVLGDIGIESFLRDLVAAELGNALSDDDAVLALPDKLMEFGFTIIDAAVIDVGGNAELVATATTELDGPQLTRALAALANGLQKAD